MEAQAERTRAKVASSTYQRVEVSGDRRLLQSAKRGSGRHKQVHREHQRHPLSKGLHTNSGMGVTLEPMQHLPSTMPPAQFSPNTHARCLMPCSKARPTEQVLSSHACARACIAATVYARPYSRLSHIRNRFPKKAVLQDLKTKKLGSEGAQIRNWA